MYVLNTAWKLFLDCIESAWVLSGTAAADILHPDELEILNGGFQKEMKVQHPFRDNKTS